MKRTKSYKGLQENVRRLKTPAIEVFDNKYPDREYTIHIETPEFTCVCPKTGLPDFATIKIYYQPDQKCIELKSLKMYFLFYRNLGIFHEHLTNRILEDCVKSTSCRWMKVEAIMNPRGGITTTVSTCYSKGKKRQPKDHNDDTP